MAHSAARSMKNLRSLLPALACLFPLCHTAIAETASAKESPTSHTFRLKPSPEDFWWTQEIDLTHTGIDFAKEPAFTDPNVIRGILPGREAGKDGIGFAWECRTGLLYLDLNRNGDLTDDPGGKFESSDTDRRWSGLLTSSYDHIAITVPQDATPVPYRVSLRLTKSPSHVDAVLWLHLRWQGEIDLAGRRLDLGVTDNLDGILDSKDYFELCSPTHHGRIPQDILDLRFTGCPRYFSLGDHHYEVSYEFVPEKRTCGLEVTFEEVTPELGEVYIDGDHVSQLILRTGQDDSSSVVALTKPGSRISVPAGNYRYLQVYLNANDPRPWFAGGNGPCSLNVVPGQTATLPVGAPLNNSVRVSRHGTVLDIEFQVLGRGNEIYRVNNPDAPNQIFTGTATFEARKWGHRIASGAFDYG